MITIMEERREVRKGGHRRQVPGGPLRQVGAPVDQGTTGVVSAVNETEAVSLGEGVIDEETVLTGGPLNDAMVIEPGAMVDSMRGATTSRGTIHGRLHVG